MERHVCTLEQAKELKELGVDQESLFWWDEDIEAVYWIVRTDTETSELERLAAFTVSELGLMLPPGAWSCIMANKGGWICFVPGSYSLEGVYTTEAEARAAKLIQLLKDGKIKVEEINERLGAVAV